MAPVADRRHESRGPRAVKQGRSATSRPRAALLTYVAQQLHCCCHGQARRARPGTPATSRTSTPSPAAWTWTSTPSSLLSPCRFTAETAEEASDVTGQQLWLLERGEVPAPVVFGPLGDIVRPLGDVPQRDEVVVREDRQRGRRRRRLGLAGWIAGVRPFV